MKTADTAKYEYGCSILSTTEELSTRIYCMGII
ncbi:uncharacterized protein METZ01_LOCUS202291 [marine metagenome]|uniref:Uncharacterized protein n=1 Tax=marine metagenome TaxID=408172 RepID=A0A382EHT8_9ZZZZ